MKNKIGRQPDQNTGAESDDLRFSVSLALFYAGMFAGFGLYLPFFPLWLAAKGLNGDEIGLVLAVATFMRIITVPLVTRLADLGGSIRRAMMVSSVACAVLFLSVGLAKGLWGILLAVVLTCIAWNPMLPLTDAYGLSGVAKRGLDYGRIRVYGSLAFMLANIGGGWAVGYLGADSVVWLIAVTLVLTAAASFAIVPDRERASLDMPQGESELRLFSWPLMLIMAGTSAIQASHALFYGFGSLHQRTLGISDPVIGLMWAIGVFTEIVLFWFAARLYDWFSPKQLILIGGAGAILRWTITAFDPPVLVQALLQTLHGASFGLTHLGMMAVMQASIPARSRASGQGIFTVLAGLGMALASLASGVLYQAFAGQAFHAMTLIALAGTAVVVFTQPQSEGAEGKTVDPS